MPRTSLALAAVLTGVLTAVLLPSSSTAVEAPDRASARAAGIERRIVFDQFKKPRRGIHLRSAEVDGSDVRRVYDFGHGFTLDLVMDHRGRRVAFGTCCNDDFPKLVIASVSGGRAVQPLASHPEVDFVAGIGWSPDDSQLAFEGFTDLGETLDLALWTVGADGSGLRRVLDLPEAEQPFTNSTLAWTGAGIMYSDGQDLRVVAAEPPADGSPAASRVVLPDVRSVRISGNGQVIVTIRGTTPSATQTVWIGAADGTEQRRVLTLGFRPNKPFYHPNLVPDYTGRRLLTVREGAAHAGPGDLVTWRADRRPSTAKSIESIEPRGGAITWN